MTQEIDDFFVDLSFIKNEDKRLDLIYDKIDDWLWTKDHSTFFEEIFEHLIIHHNHFSITSMLGFLTITRPIKDKSVKREWLCLLLQEHWNKTEGAKRTANLLGGLM